MIEKVRSWDFWILSATQTVKIKSWCRKIFNFIEGYHEIFLITKVVLSLSFDTVFTKLCFKNNNLLSLLARRLNIRKTVAGHVYSSEHIDITDISFLGDDVIVGQSEIMRKWRPGDCYTKNELWLYERFFNVINIPFVSRSCTQVFRFKYVLEGIF